ncbi:hypothetical protein [Reichenbachiella versicolor]|uniref:hypothetical protein n=1 Tax=Reichenbachiella versicolor TaxID=1821036 RepID=UPI000D6DC937|nr:hypothetical protein [Reichenbachiella versicolor]
MTDAVLFFFIGIGTVIVCFGTGWVFTYKTLSFSLMSFILQTIIGSLVLVCVYAIIITQGKTIYWSILLALMVLIWSIHKNKIDLPNRYHFKSCAFIIIVSYSITYLLSFSQTIDLSQNKIRTEFPKSGKYHPDYHFYTSITHYLTETGQENEFHVYNALDKSYHGTTSYHYYELWLHSLIAKLAGLNLHKSYSSIAEQFFLFLVHLALITLLQQHTNRSNWEILTISTMLIISAPYPVGKDLFPLTFLNDLRFAYPLLGSTLKLSQISLFLICSYFLIKQGFSQSGLLLLTLLSLVNFTPFPAVLGTLATLFLLSTILPDFKHLRKISLVCLGISGLFIFNKLLFSNPDLSRAGTSFSSIIALKNVPPIEYWTTVKNAFFGSGLRYIVEFFSWVFPLCIVLFNSPDSALKQLKKVEVIILLSMILFCTIAFSLLGRFVDAIQLMTNIFEPIMMIFISLTLLTINRINLSLKIAYWTWLSFILISNILFVKNYLIPANLKYNQAYIERVNKFLQSEESNLIGASFDEIAPNDIDAKTYIYSLGEYLTLGKNGAYTISLSDYEIPIPSSPSLLKERFESSRNIGLFYRLVQKEIKQGIFSSIPESQLSFIKEHNIRYGIATNTYPLSPLIEEIIDYEFCDPISKERFMVFKN